jgi:hypothetical protein
MSTMRRFRIFLQPPYVPGFEQPVTVEIETPDEIEAGPADSLLYVLDAENKPAYRAQAPHQYQPFRGRPWKGKVNPVVARAGYDGHFDHLAPDDPAFPAASVYAVARHVLNFWNRIFDAVKGSEEFRDAAEDSQITSWHHRQEFLEEGENPKFAGSLQLIPRCASAGSRSGYGYVEVGRDNPGHRYRDRQDGPERLTYQRGAMWQNFDVIAHEMGHAILFKRIGFPAAAKGFRSWFAIPDAEFLAFHEAMADLVAILSLLDIKEARKFFLTRRGGIDLVAGIGELSKLDEPGFLPIRSARNKVEYPGLMQFQNDKAHDNSMSLTGAAFDSLLRIYALRTREDADIEEAESALVQARDVVAKSLARLWAHLRGKGAEPPPHRDFSFPTVSKDLVKLINSELDAQAGNVASAYEGYRAEDRIGSIFRDRKLLQL